MNRRESIASLAVMAQKPGSGIQLGCRTRVFASPLETNFRGVEHSFENPAPLRAELEKRRLDLIGLHVSSRADASRMASVTKALGGSQAVASGGKLTSAEFEDGGLQLREMLARTGPEAVSPMLDVGNPFPPDYGVTNIVQMHANRIAGFHPRDTGGGAEAPMGAGEFDFAGLARAIRETRWAGWPIVEVNRRAGVPSRKLAEMPLAHIRKTMEIQ